MHCVSNVTAPVVCCFSNIEKDATFAVHQLNRLVNRQRRTRFPRLVQHQHSQRRRQRGHQNPLLTKKLKN